MMIVCLVSVGSADALGATLKKVKTTAKGKRSGQTGSIYWGAVTGTQFGGLQAPFNMSVERDFVHQDAQGKQPSIVPWYSPFSDCSTPQCPSTMFRASTFNNVRKYGAIPLISWGSSTLEDGDEDVATDSALTLKDVADGAYDSYITAWAKAAKAWGHPFFLRFDWEMNGNWFVWGQGTNGNTPAAYVAAWRHVHDIFTKVGATNATWVWCPNVGEQTNLKALYPGNAYVDWTCLDAYNFGTENGGKWLNWNGVARSSYNLITKHIAPSKPMMIAEFNSSTAGGSRPRWLSQTLATVPREYPKIHAMVLYDTESFALEGDSASQAAFAAGISSPAYAPNSYAHLNQSPIPVP